MYISQHRYNASVYVATLICVCEAYIRRMVLSTKYSLSYSQSARFVTYFIVKVRVRANPVWPKACTSATELTASYEENRAAGWAYVTSELALARQQQREKPVGKSQVALGHIVRL